MSPTNPNNCLTCDYKRINSDGALWCYMLKDEPHEVCMRHTGRIDVGAPMIFAKQLKRPVS